MTATPRRARPALHRAMRQHLTRTFAALLAAALALPAAGEARAILLWLEQAATTEGERNDRRPADVAVLDMARLTPALNARGVQVLRIDVAVPGTEYALVGARLVVGGRSDMTDAVLAAATTGAAAAQVRGIVLFDPAPLPAGAALAAQRAEVPLLLAFDRTCTHEDVHDARVRDPAAFTAWLRLRYPHTPETARAAYPDRTVHPDLPGHPQAALQQRCRALRDARFVDGAWARAMRNPRSWLAVADAEAEADADANAEAQGSAQPPASAGPERTDDTLAARVRDDTLADYLAAFVHEGTPRVPGRPYWPMVDGSAAHYLHLGATVRAARDPLIDAIDLRAANESTLPPPMQD